MKLQSPAFAKGASIPYRFSRDGANHAPPLEFSEVPGVARSLVLIMDDPDAPSGTFTHWVAFNIDPQTPALREDELPAGARCARNSWGEPRYGGPQPPSGEHRYFFHLYALDDTLNLSAGTTRANVEKAMSDHVIATADLMGRYSRHDR